MASFMAGITRSIVGRMAEATARAKPREHEQSCGTQGSGAHRIAWVMWRLEGCPAWEATERETFRAAVGPSNEKNGVRQCPLPFFPFFEALHDESQRYLQP